MRLFYNFITGEIDLVDVDTEVLRDGTEINLLDRDLGDVEVSLGDRTNTAGEMDFGNR